MTSDPLNAAAGTPPDGGSQNAGLLVLLLVGIPLLAAVAIVIWTLGPLLLGHWRQQDVLAHGLPAEAQILSLQDTGTLINYQPLVAITLEVMPPGKPPYQAVVKQTVSSLNAAYFAQGNFVPVKYDPTHPDRVAFTFGPGHTGTLPGSNSSAPSSFSISITTSTSSSSTTETSP